MRCWLLAVVVACAPHVDGPVEQQRTRDRADASALERELVHSGARQAHVALARPTVDPFTGARSAGAAGAVLVVDGPDQIAPITRAATVLLHAAVPDVEPVLAVQVTPPSPARSPRWPLAVAFAAIAIVAAGLAWRERHRVIVRP